MKGSALPKFLTHNLKIVGSNNGAFTTSLLKIIYKVIGKIHTRAFLIYKHVCSVEFLVPMEEI